MFKFNKIFNKYKLSLNVIGIAILIFISIWITHQSGENRSVIDQVYYLPIILASYTFGITGGLFTGLIVSIITSPILPINFSHFIQQSIPTRMIQDFYFILTGVFMGSLFTLYKYKKYLLQKSLENISLNYTKILENLAFYIEKKDEQTLGHSKRVAYNSYLIGKEMNLKSHELNNLYWAGMLHDIGKIGVIDKILNKSSQLTESEFNEIKKHTIIGYELVNTISNDFRAIAIGIKYHHERWDGTGYPNGLKNEEIPFFGRIIAVADVFEALTSKRPYREPIDKNEAFNYMINNSGTHFDPDIIKIFENLYDKDLIIVEKSPDFKVGSPSYLNYGTHNILENYKKNMLDKFSDSCLLKHLLILMKIKLKNNN
jgi:hypothetical protein